MSGNHHFVLYVLFVSVFVLFVCDLLFKKSILATMWRTEVDRSVEPYDGVWERRGLARVVEWSGGNRRIQDIFWK